MEDEVDPNITFDEFGVCSYCHEYEKNEKQRKIDVSQLPWIIHQIKKDGAGKKYDVILGLSGGVDSSTCLHYLLQHGVRPFCFSIDNGWNEPLADQNIMNLVETAKVRFYRYTIDKVKFFELQKALIMSGVKNLEAATDHILMAATYEMAKEYDIKWVIGGGNLATESTMPVAWGHNARDLTFLKDVYKKHIGKKLTGLPLISLPTYLKRRFVDGIKIVNLLDYYTFNKEEAKRTLKEIYGWKAYSSKHGESKFTKWFQDTYLPQRFGIDKRRAHLSSLIMSKQITRDQALEELSILVTEVPTSYIEKKLGMKIPLTESDASHLDYKNSEEIWNSLSKLYRSWK